MYYHFQLVADGDFHDHNNDILKSEVLTDIVVIF